MPRAFQTAPAFVVNARTAYSNVTDCSCSFLKLKKPQVSPKHLKFLKNFSAFPQNNTIGDFTWKVREHREQDAAAEPQTQHPTMSTDIPVINLISDEEDPPQQWRRVPEVGRRRQRKRGHPVIAVDESDSEVVLVSHMRGGEAKEMLAPVTSEGKRPRRSKRRTADGVECVGEQVGVRACVDYAHFRFQCGVEEFGKKKKLEFCPNCFCYVCDVRAGECVDWLEHATATDTNPESVRLRRVFLRMAHEQKAAEEADDAERQGRQEEEEGRREAEERCSMQRSHVIVQQAGRPLIKRRTPVLTHCSTEDASMFPNVWGLRDDESSDSDDSTYNSQSADKDSEWQS